MKLAWMYMSLPVGLTLMIFVNIELIVKNFIWLWNPNFEFPEDPYKPKTERN